MGDEQPVQTAFPQRVDRSDRRSGQGEDDERDMDRDERLRREREELGPDGSRPPGSPDAPRPQGQQPGPQRGPSRWIHTTPAAPPVEER